MKGLRIQYNAPVVVTFAILCTAIYMINYITGGDAVSRSGGIINNYFVLRGFDFANPLDYFRLFSYTIGHANRGHLVGNMSIFLLIAPIMEEKYGSRNILIMMLLTALITAIFQVFLIGGGLLGASGIVFMFIILVSFANTGGKGIPLTFILVLIFFLGKEVLNSLDNNNISEYAHIAGGIMGAFFGFNLNGSKDPSQEQIL